jgi:hypothetical protein
MRLSLLFFVILAVSVSSFAQSDKEFSRTVFSKDISFIRPDTTHGSQSTVVEYPGFLVVIELPMFKDGANRATNLEQDIPKAERFLSFLKRQYNNKPIKYVLSSHWHLHSTSGITPFMNHGATLVSTKKNWDYCVKHGLLRNFDVKSLEKQVLFVEKDTQILGKTENPISVLYLDESYTNKPTSDYLFFYMPKNRCIHASCMCAMSEIDFKQRPTFIYNDRVTDLEKAIKLRNLEVDNLFKLTQDYDEVNKTYKIPAFSQAYYAEFKQRGKPLAYLVKEYADYDLTILTTKKDSILNHLLTKKIGAGMINSAVYACIKQKEYAKAVQWAQILNLYQIGEPSFLDSLGEAYYFAGDKAMAQNISNQLGKLNKDMSNQMLVWETNFGHEQ